MNTTNIATNTTKISLDVTETVTNLADALNGIRTMRPSLQLMATIASKINIPLIDGTIPYGATSSDA